MELRYGRRGSAHRQNLFNLGLTIPFVDAPSLPKGTDRDFVPKRDDWDEVSDPFGMVRVRMSIPSTVKTRREIVDWIISEARIPEIAIGEVEQDSESTIVEIHVEKVAYVIDVIKGREIRWRLSET